MRIYYFVHVVGRDNGNSGIPRVSRNLASVLDAMPGIELAPVRWDEATSSIVHAEPSFRAVMNMHGGPALAEVGTPGTPIHLDFKAGGDAPWLFVPEVPHLGMDTDNIRPTQLPYVAGYARRHGMKTAAIFHDAMPITHFGEENSFQSSALTFVAYTQSLASFDLVLPVSQASAEALTGLWGRYGLEWRPQQTLQAILLPEETKGLGHLSSLGSWPAAAGSRMEFCIWGTLFPHKNHLAVMEAFNALCQRRPDLDLVLNHVGLVDAQCAEAVRRQVRRSQGRIKLHGFTSDEKLMAVIGRSHATLFVSLAEGYGLPLAESLWLGKPCITSNVAPMTEVAAGGGAVLVDPTSIAAISDAMERLVTDREFYSGLLDQIRARPMRRWQDYGEAVWAALQQAGAVLATADAAAAPAYYTPEQRKRPVLRIESALFNVGDLNLTRELVQLGATQSAGGILEYRPTAPMRRAEFLQRTISYGPYHTVGPGEFHFQIEGEVEGRCQVFITSHEGQRRHLDVELSSFAGDIIVTAPDGMEKMEIVFLTTPSLEYLRLEGISMTRYYAG